MLTLYILAILLEIFRKRILFKKNIMCHYIKVHDGTTVAKFSMRNHLYYRNKYVNAVSTIEKITKNLLGVYKMAKIAIEILSITEI